jgi:aminoglycoside phosphotransferase (APT) family kinase protein
MPAGKDTIMVRKGEELDLDSLVMFLESKVDSFPGGPLEVLQFSAGHSNLTYQLRSWDWEAVLRRPPLGPVAAKAHDMEREFIILKELNSMFSPAPKPIIYTGDDSIIGSPFFLMERKNGIVLDTEFPEHITPSVEVCRHLSQTMVDKLSELHSLPYRDTGLEKISRPEGFMERQVHGWISRYEKAKTEEIKEAAALTKWLSANIPSESGHSIIHYDYKLNNSMFDHKLEAMTGLFDWEMSTVGDPLADLGAAMSYWIQEDDPDLLKYGLGKPPVTALKGFYSRKEFMEAYARRSGRDISDMNFYLTFAYFKLAVICQQIYYRYKKGQTADKRFSQFDRFVRSLIQHSSSIAYEKA